MAEEHSALLAVQRRELTNITETDRQIRGYTFGCFFSVFVARGKQLTEYM